ncbi:hypothetical protein L1S32_10555 [Methanogenium sp. S4BF]|uniref:hypothetical protein n=1 Tax=Methanogenium sp. S4BF TaxID=1789226 RepID=UPI002417D550|nr:hypothetical protein [Methanogenium sp. S4BF]WFN34272.1 hypothetical protein L1S32_10555 [Methanogenium sp. S4BF]
MADSVILGFLISAAVIGVILLLAHALVRTDGGNILNIIRADYWVPSLSLFQFLLWTLVISFSYIWITAIRIFEGNFLFSTAIPPNLYLLLGISVVVPLISVGYTKSTYKPDTPAKPPENLPPFGMMLKTKGKIALNRFQMFLWTIVGVVLYLSVVVGTVTDGGDAALLSLPDIDPTLVYLMGLSQTGYLGGRLVGEEKPPAKTKTMAKEPSAGKADTSPAVAVASAESVAMTAEQTKQSRKRMPESVRRFLVDDLGHSRSVQDRLEIAIDKAEIKGFSRYYLIGDGFYYLIDRGQIRGAGKGSQVDIMRHISDVKDEIGEAEVLQV